MSKGHALLVAITFACLLAAMPARAQSYLCEDHVELDDATMDCFKFGPEAPPPAVPEPPKPDPIHMRMLRYAQVALKHRLSGLASYYSTSLDGTPDRERRDYRNKQDLRRAPHAAARHLGGDDVARDRDASSACA